MKEELILISRKHTHTHIYVDVESKMSFNNSASMYIKSIMTSYLEYLSFVI